MDYRGWEREVARWRAMPDPPREPPYPPPTPVRRQVFPVETEAPLVEDRALLAAMGMIPHADRFDGYEAPVMTVEDGIERRVKPASPTTYGYEGSSTECVRCGEDTIPKQWPETRLCWPCLHGPPARYELSGVVYDDGGRSFRPRYACCRIGSCWIPPDDLPAGLRVKFRTPPDRAPATPKHWNPAERAAYRRWFHGKREEVIEWMNRTGIEHEREP